MRIGTGVWIVFVSTWLASARTGMAADLGGSWSGSLSSTKSGGTVDVALVLQRAGKDLSGTAAVLAGDATLDGSYTVHGTVVGKRLRVRGVGAGGAQIALHGSVARSVLSGRGVLRAGARHRSGRLTLTRQTSNGDGSSCDAVYQQNQSAFAQLDDQVLTRTCAACHVSGGRAGSTRLRVTAGDPATTARSVATVVDPTDPAKSALVRKPTGAVAHGGGIQVDPGSPEEALLLQWATLIADAKCTSGGGSGDPYTSRCASCHGSNGGGAGDAPDVRCTVRPLLTSAVREGRGAAMPAFGTSEVSATDLDAIVGFLASQCSGQPADVFAANCASCHGADGSGGSGGPNVACAGAGDLAEVLSSGEEGMPAFPSLVGRAGGLAKWLHASCTGGAGGDD